VLKTFRLPFDALRANGASLENVAVSPFAVSVSNHEKGFFNTLLA